MGLAPHLSQSVLGLVQVLVHLQRFEVLGVCPKGLSFLAVSQTERLIRCAQRALYSVRRREAFSSSAPRAASGLFSEFQRAPRQAKPPSALLKAARLYQPADRNFFLYRLA